MATETSGSSTGSLLKGLDYSVVQQCMHCGLCLPTCPTYDATKLERNSPRGRIALMRAIADDRLEPSKAFADEMYFCLGCLACMTACPAGVNYAELFEHSRAEAERVGALSSPRRNLIRNLTVKWLFMDHNRLQFVGSLIRFYQMSGLQNLIRNSGILRWLPQRLQGLEAMTPTVKRSFSNELIPPRARPEGKARYKVALLTGCAQDLIFSDVNRDTMEVLIANGCEVVTPPNQQCCGSLHAHNGELEHARILARHQLDQFPPDDYDAIITNAAGCGSHLKHYTNLLANDPIYGAKARQWDLKIKDIHEWLIVIGVRLPDKSVQPTQKVTYHEACHLCHGQGISSQPRQVLKSIPNLDLCELPESTWCCGSAGIYNIVQPEMAGDLLKRKVHHIESTEATIVATGNPGCLLHIENGIRQAGLQTRLAHPVTLLAEAYRRGKTMT